MYERLAKGVGEKDDLDDPQYSPQQIYQWIAFHYSNDKIVIKFPDGMNDVNGVEDIDANDKMMRISIKRDCKHIRSLFCMYFVILTRIYSFIVIRELD